MNIDHIGGVIYASPGSIVAWSIAVLAVAAAFVVKPFLVWRKASLIGYDLLVWIPLIVAGGAFTMGFIVNGELEKQADNKAFAEQLKNDYGVAAKAPLDEIRITATYNGTIVLTDAAGSFEARPHLDGTSLTFFRVDNGKQVNRLDS